MLNPPAGWDAEDALRITFERFVLLGDYRGARDLIDAFHRDSIRIALISYFRSPGLGRQPTADLRGWVDLALDDHDAASVDGRTLLAAVERTPETRWNAWFRAALKADGQLFTGRPDEAAATAATILDLDAETLTAVSAEAQLLSRALVAAFGATSLNIFQNNGVDANQHYAHYHMHVVPRYPGSDPTKIYQEKDFMRISIPEQRRIAEKVQRALAQLDA